MGRTDADPVGEISKDYAKRLRLVCIDEFQVQPLVLEVRVRLLGDGYC